jgi:uncharacterized protein YecE (DUF72 family)
VGDLLLGTSSWSEKSWVGPFYPSGTKPADFLAHYATQFRTVEVDATYYRMPSRATVEGWARKTPGGFTMAAKFPKSIVHAGKGPQPDPKKLLSKSAQNEAADFCGLMRELGDKCGPLLLQFPYFNQHAFGDADAFFERLDPFLAALPSGHRYAVEIRNRGWLGKPLCDLLRRHQAALVLVDLSYMPHPADVVAAGDVVTADFAYGRLIGDRKKIDAITKRWDKVVVNQTQRLERWLDVVREIAPRVNRTWIFANNHYAGHGPATVRDLAARTGAALADGGPAPGAQQELF